MIDNRTPIGHLVTVNSAYGYYAGTTGTLESVTEGYFEQPDLCDCCDHDAHEYESEWLDGVGVMVVVSAAPGRAIVGQRLGFDFPHLDTVPHVE